MQYKSTLIVVRDMEISRRFYQDVLGLKVVNDFGANVELEGGIALQTVISWQRFINRSAVTFGGNASEIYFEEPELGRFVEHLKGFEIKYVHPLTEHRWGQRVIRFYDPDLYMIEVGEAMSTVVKRFAAQGMTPEEVAERMDVSIDYVCERLNA